MRGAGSAEAGGSDVFTLRDSLRVNAPAERCFDLSCAVALVHEELGMDAVSGRRTGLVAGGDVIRWEGWQLGMKHFHVSHISAFNRPVFFQDTMLEGRFRTFQHDHHFTPQPDGTTLLHDELRFSLPFGALGRIVARFIMVPHIRRLMRSRFQRLRRVAEGDAWHSYLPE